MLIENYKPKDGLYQIGMVVRMLKVNRDRVISLAKELEIKTVWKNRGVNEIRWRFYHKKDVELMLKKITH